MALGLSLCPTLTPVQHPLLSGPYDAGSVSVQFGISDAAALE